MVVAGCRKGVGKYQKRWWFLSHMVVGSGAVMLFIEVGRECVGGKRSTVNSWKWGYETYSMRVGKNEVMCYLKPVEKVSLVLRSR